MTANTTGFSEPRTHSGDRPPPSSFVPGRVQTSDQNDFASSAAADDTAVLEHLPEAPSPVFVDESGRRNRRLRLGVYAAGVLCLLYAALVAMSLAGGAVGPDALLPFPDLVQRPAVNRTEPPRQAPPTPSLTAARSDGDAGRPRPGQPRDGRAGNRPETPAKPGHRGPRPEATGVVPRTTGAAETTAVPSAVPSVLAEPETEPSPEPANARPAVSPGAGQ